MSSFSRIPTLRIALSITIVSLRRITVTYRMIAALVLTRFLSGLLYGVRPADPATLGCVALLLGGVALLASYIPARRATRVDPVVALRCE